jgi:hypothetical protein
MLESRTDQMFLLMAPGSLKTALERPVSAVRVEDRNMRLHTNNNKRTIPTTLAAGSAKAVCELVYIAGIRKAVS